MTIKIELPIHFSFLWRLLRFRKEEEPATAARSTSPVMPNLSASTTGAGFLQATPTNGHAPSDSTPMAVLSSSSASVLQKLASSSPALATNQMEQNGAQMMSSVVVHSEGRDGEAPPFRMAQSRYDEQVSVNQNGMGADVGGLVNFELLVPNEATWIG